MYTGNQNGIQTSSSVCPGDSHSVSGAFLISNSSLTPLSVYPREGGLEFWVARAISALDMYSSNVGVIGKRLMLGRMRMQIVLCQEIYKCQELEAGVKYGMQC